MEMATFIESSQKHQILALRTNCGVTYVPHPKYEALKIATEETEKNPNNLRQREYTSKCNQFAFREIVCLHRRTGLALRAFYNVGLVQIKYGSLC
jgi:hypothetical protein